MKKQGRQNEAEYWRAKAAEYQKTIENDKHRIVTAPARIYRMLVVVVDGNPNETLHFYSRAEASNGLKNLKARGKKFKMIRMWRVVKAGPGSDGAYGQWERLVMAQAQRDGWNFHYARHVLLGESEKWARELGGGIK